MKRRLTLSRETLRTLDAQELSMVVGGSDHEHHHHHGHGKTGRFDSCNAKSAKPSDSRCD